MGNTAIIYIRKSTDREDKQQNSIEHQRINCRQTAHRYGLDVIDEIIESASAKESGKRAGFKRMLKTLKGGSVDFLVVDEPKRISRNTIDTAHIVDCLEKKLFRAIFTSGKKYCGDDSTDVFMLGLDLELSKKDNKDRSKDTRSKMLTAARNGKFMGTAPYGYINTGKKGDRHLEQHLTQAPWVKKMFELRSIGYSLDEIAYYLNKNEVMTHTKRGLWKHQTVMDILRRKSYFGIQVWGGEENEITHDMFDPIITKRLFNKAQRVLPPHQPNPNKDEMTFHFKKLIKDPSDIVLSGYRKKGRTYYHCQYRSPHKINISEISLFNSLEEVMKSYVFPEELIKLSRDILKEIYKDKIGERTRQIKKINQDIRLIEKRIDALFDKYIDHEISKTIYTSRNKIYQQKQKELQDEMESLNLGDKNILKIIDNLCELLRCLHTSYSCSSEKNKEKILRSIQCELFIDAQKQLTIQESELFECVRKGFFLTWQARSNGVRTFDHLLPVYQYIITHIPQIENLIICGKRYIN